MAKTTSTGHAQPRSKAPPRKTQTPPRTSQKISDSGLDTEDEVASIVNRKEEALAEALTFAGHYSPSLEMSTTTQKWCTCNIDPSKTVDLNTIIRCDNRACDPGRYHLSCVQLTEHPPRHLTWFCPRCIAEGLVVEHRNGVFNLKDKGGVAPVEAWWREEMQRWGRKRAVAERGWAKRREMARIVREDGAEVKGGEVREPELKVGEGAEDQSS